jgi:formylglycine-generating enzyme required for sulfatase activity
VVRGGSWFLNPEDARVAIRGRIGPSDRNFTYGFRLARTL